MVNAALERKDLLSFIESYVVMKELSSDQIKPQYQVRNVIDMDIIELKCETLFGKLNLEICHYLKNRTYSDGMTVKFRFDDAVSHDVKSRVRSTIFRKEVSNYQDKLEEIELVSLQINTVQEFVDFFQSSIIEVDLPTKKGVRSFIK